MESLVVALETVRTAIVVGLLVVLPGVAIGPYLVPRASAPLARLARAVGVGLLATSAACTLLVVVGLLRPTIAATVLAGLAVLPLHLGPPSWRRIRHRTRRWWAVLAGSALVVAALVVVPALVRAAPGALPFAPTDWAGVTRALVLASAAGQPAELPAWGGGLPLAGADLPAAAHLAAAIQLLPGELLDRVVVYRLVMTIAAIVVTAALIRRWLSSWAAVAAAGLFVGLAGGLSPLLGDPTAALPLVLGVFALSLADRALVERSARLVAATALVGGAVAMQRIDLFLAVVAGTAALGAGRWLVSPGGGPENAGGLGHRWGRRLGLRVSLRRAAVAPLLAGAAVLLAGGGVGGFGSGVLGLIGPTSGVLGTIGEGPGGAPFVGLDEMPAGWRPGDDGSWDLERATLSAPAERLAPPTVADPAFLAASAAAVLAGGSAAPAGPLAVGALLVLGLFAWPTLDQRRQRFVATLAVFGVGLAVAALLVFAAEAPFGARRVALDRLLPLGWLVAAAGVGYVGWLGGRVLARRAGPRLGPTAVVATVAVAAAAVLAAAPVGRAAPAGDPLALRDQPLSVVGAAAYRSVAARLPPAARILANARTDGVVAALGGRVGLLDGPDLPPEASDLVARSTALVLAARVAFLEPDGDAARAYLLREGVSHLLVGGEYATPADLGGGPLFPIDLAALLASERYALIETIGDRVYLFEVLPPS